jgi:type VI protein secretion system component Hcp
MSEDQIDRKNDKSDVIELSDQQLGTVSGGGAAGAGKVSFNPFSITRKIDKASPIFFQ